MSEQHGSGVSCYSSDYFSRITNSKLSNAKNKVVEMNTDMLKLVDVSFTENKIKVLSENCRPVYNFKERVFTVWN